VFIEAKDDGGGGDNLSYKSCKAPVKSSPPTNQHPVFLQAGCPSCHPTNSVKALKGKKHWTGRSIYNFHILFNWPILLKITSDYIWFQRQGGRRFVGE